MRTPPLRRGGGLFSCCSREGPRLSLLHLVYLSGGMICGPTAKGIGAFDCSGLCETYHVSESNWKTSLTLF